jgi:hypothetical protein
MGLDGYSEIWMDRIVGRLDYCAKRPTWLIGLELLIG